tara:strand:+ start:2476 stop:4005 length:1530 start_codon:yes stop_codon:yes gene_type:complete
MSAFNKIIVNTIVLYIKLFISIIVAFITARLVLNALGEVDYGINSLIAGIIGMLAFLQTTISTASIRFLAFGLGSGDIEQLKKTFNSSLIIHIIIGLIIVFIIELGGLILFNTTLNIPVERINDAKIVFHLMALTTYVTIVSVPYNAVMNAHEDFIPLAVIETIGMLITLMIAVFISNYEGNKLVTYASLITVNYILQRIIFQIYTGRKYEECKLSFSKFIDKSLIKQMMTFAGWKTLDAGTSVLYVQLKAVLLNIYFGVVVNAANGLASNLTMQINNFSANLTTAINPQLIKAEAAGDRGRMIELTKTSAKFSVFVFSILSLWVLIETDFILVTWLKNVPEYTSLFVRLLLIEMLLQKFTHPLTTSFQAINRIKEITFVVIINLVLQLIAVFYLYNNGYSPTTIYFISIVGTIVSSIVRLYYANKFLNIEIMDYMESVIFKSVIPIILALTITMLVISLMEESYFRLLISMSLVTTVLLISIRYYGLTKNEFLFIKGIFKKLLLKFKK